MDHRAQKVWQLIEPVVEGLGYELVGVALLNPSRSCTLRVYIDKPDGIKLDDCAAVSHQVSGVLDVEDPIKLAYSLEVSSPGLDRPLFKVADYARFVGQRAKIRMAVPLNGRRNFTGTLLAVNDDVINIEVDENQFELPFTQIDRANLVPQI